MRTFSQRDLDQKIITMVNDARRRFSVPEGCDGETTCGKIGLKVSRGRLPSGTDGVLAGNHVIVNRNIDWRSRVEFTIFHEVFHHLLEEDGEIIEFFTELSRSDPTAYDAAIERCCHQGAAEFLMPRAKVNEAVATEGLSVNLIELISERHGASIVASAIQIARCAPVDCYVVVCSYGQAPKSSPPHRGLFVEYAAFPWRVKYMLGRFSPVYSDNLLVQAWQTRQRVQGLSYVPFRSAARKRPEDRMKCFCDAKRFGGRVLGMLLLGEPVPPGQLALSLEGI